jgi:hypothetical protein
MAAVKADGTTPGGASVLPRSNCANGGRDRHAGRHRLAEMARRSTHTARISPLQPGRRAPRQPRRALALMLTLLLATAVVTAAVVLLG